MTIHDFNFKLNFNKCQIYAVAIDDGDDDDDDDRDDTHRYVYGWLNETTHDDLFAKMLVWVRKNDAHSLIEIIKG